LIAVTGACQIDEWTDQQGQRQKMVKLNGDGLQLLESKREREERDGAQEPAGRQQPAQQPLIDDDDIPPF
jgi:single-stranded DNA-binding protein